jgi:hypothetical protein
MRPISTALAIACIAFAGCAEQPGARAQAVVPPQSAVPESSRSDSMTAARASSEPDRGGSGPSSRYTSLARDDCTLEDVDEEAGGVSGYRLVLLEGDARQTLNVL